MHNKPQKSTTKTHPKIIYRLWRYYVWFAQKGKLSRSALPYSELLAVVFTGKKKPNLIVRTNAANAPGVIITCSHSHQISSHPEFGDLKRKRRDGVRITEVAICV